MRDTSHRPSHSSEHREAGLPHAGTDRELFGIVRRAVLNLVRGEGTLTRMETKHKPDVEEAPKLYAIVVGGSNGQMAPEFAAALQEYCDARDNDANGWEKRAEKKEVLEEMGRLFAEWQEENGAFTEEEMARARALKSGVDLRS